MDDTSSLTRAVLYGRTLLKSIRKFLIFQLSVNVAAILVASWPLLWGGPSIMTQMLWINLVMDTLAAIAFAGEAALSQDEGTTNPQKCSTDHSDMWSAIFTNGIILSVCSS